PPSTSTLSLHDALPILTFDSARVPEANLLGERGRGYANFLQTLDDGRIAIAALATGAAQGCVDQAVAYATSRNAFGTPIGSFQRSEEHTSELQSRENLV